MGSSSWSDFENEKFSEQQFLQFYNIAVSDFISPNSNNNDHINEEWFRITTAFSYGILAFAGLLSFAGLLCNCLFCYVIWRSKKLHTVTHMLMTNLALSNILFLLFHPPFFMSTYILQTNWIFGTIMCKASFSIMYVTATGSFYFMSLVAIDRWLAIFRRKSRLNKRKCIGLTAFVWLIAFTVASPYLYLSGEVNIMGKEFSGIHDPDIIPNRVQCGIDCPSCKRVLQITTIIAQYGIPLCILCWSPLFSVGVLHAYKLIKNDSLSIYIYTSMIALLGVVLTPCFYLLNDGFRKQIFLIVPCCKSHNVIQNTKAQDNTSNLENVLKSQEPNRAQQCSPLLASGNSTKQSSMELTARFSGSDIISYTPRKASIDLPSKHSLDAKVKHVRV
uniref:G-protein coupled receptors family 1 profile domain-containing protein n=2 Tax=Panagrolaimus sp. PS1159 TaxID=55785 RepID=A0AC35G618_9BILA